MTQIIVNDSVLDLFPDTVITQTLKAFDLATFNTTFRNYTNTISIPFTENNNQILGNANVVQSQTSIPYANNNCRVIQNGVELINDGLLVIRGATEKAYSIFILSGITFFDAVGTLKLTDLDFTGGINGPLLTASATIMNTTTGRINPVMNYGRFNTTTYSPEYAMIEENTFPSFYYHTLIDKIFSDAGYPKSGDIFSDTKYLNTIVPYGRSDWSYGGDFINQRTSIFDKSVSQAIASANLSTTDITFPIEVYNGSLGYYDGISAYTAIESDASSGDKLFSMAVQLTIDITVTGGTINLRLVNGISGTLFQTGVGTGSYSSEISDYGVESTALSIRGQIATGTPNVTINSARISFIPDKIPVVGTPAYVYFNLLLPEISQRDFLKDFSIRFGQYFQEVNGTVYCKSIDDIISDTANAKDWTQKRVRQPDSISYTPAGLGANNYFRYDNSDLQVSKDFAEGNITISNANLKDEVVLSSKFGASATGLVGNIYMAKVNIYDGTQTNFAESFSYNPGIRVLLVRDRYSYEASVRVRTDVAATTSYKVAYFDDPIQSNTCRWQQTIDTYYPLYAAALQKYKMVTREYVLTESDIQNMDFFVPVFDNDSYYLVNTVGPYIANKPCKVVMFKI